MEEKQQFSTFDSVSVLALFTGVLILVGSIVSNATSDQKDTRARAVAGQLATQILFEGFKAPSAAATNLGRGPASLADLKIKPEGQLGMDPWGQPYHYRVTQDQMGHRVALVISSGPNQKNETLDEDLMDKHSSSQFEDLVFKGDDVGVVSRDR